MAGLTIEAGIARGLMKFAVSRGADPAVLAQRSGIDPESLHDPDTRVPFDSYVTLMRTAKELLGDPALALHYAEHVDFSEISIVGLLAHGSETMMEALAQMNRYGRLAVEFHGDGDRFAVTQEKDGLWVIDTRQDPNAFPELTETTFGRMAWGTRQFGKTPFVTAVEVTHADPGYPDEYVRIFAAPVTFGCSRNAMRVDASWSDNRVARLPRYVFGVLSERAEGLLKCLQSAQTVRGKVESLMMPILHTGEVDMDRVARALGVSRQTLFRKLKAEGVTFVGVLDELRQKLAIHYLSGKKVSVNETAYLVGFSDPAAFSRAFKRWTGASPRTVKPPKAGAPGTS